VVSESSRNGDVRRVSRRTRDRHGRNRSGHGGATEARWMTAIGRCIVGPSRVRRFSCGKRASKLDGPVTGLGRNEGQASGKQGHPIGRR
jgi:hypothetical protein